MSDRGRQITTDNPFLVSRVRPGSIPYHFPPGQSPQSLLRRLGDNGWRGQIVGPHGSGKSALLASLRESLQLAGRGVLVVELHDRQRRLPGGLRGLTGLKPNTLVVIDGYEQLAVWNRFWLKRFCRKRRLGLIVTTHTSIGLPDLVRTTTSLETAQRIVRDLNRQAESTVSPDEVADAFARHQGNLRETFFDLYDLHERRR